MLLLHLKCPCYGTDASSYGMDPIMDTVLIALALISINAGRDLRSMKMLIA